METPGTGLGLTLPSAAEAASPPSPPLTTIPAPSLIRSRFTLQYTFNFGVVQFPNIILVRSFYCNSMLDIKMLHRWVDNIDISADY